MEKQHISNHQKTWNFEARHGADSGGYDFWRLRLFGPILTITFQQVDNDAGKKAVNRVLGITGCA